MKVYFQTFIDDEAGTSPMCNLACGKVRGMNKQVICDIDGQFFGLDSMCVRSIENGTAEMSLGNAPGFVEGIIKFRGEWVPIIRLRTLFGIDKSEEPKLSQLIYLRTENGTMAFRVDKVVEIDQLEEGEFQTIPIIVNSGKSAYVSGACSHHGRIIVIVDHNRLLSRDEMQQVKDGLKAVYEAEEAEKRRKEEEETKRRAEEEEKRKAEEEAEHSKQAGSESNTTEKTNKTDKEDTSVKTEDKETGTEKSSGQKDNKKPNKKKNGPAQTK
ncbi:MAG: chemotaxis protein CheW [Lachnospiraceae bacterium]|nr:chemotaxis protein CheW [Lachnospiraceae bacterium]